MSQYVQLWEDLGLDVPLHNRLLATLGAAYDRIIRRQPNRPAAMAYFDEAVHASHGRRVQEIVDAREQGAKMIGTFCIYVPEEIVLAAGAIPVALCGGTAFSVPYAERMFPRDICPLVKSTFGMAIADICPYGPIKDMAVGETTCDAKKKIWDLLSEKVNFHVLELPQKKTELGRELWLREVREFARSLEELTGNCIQPEVLARKTKLMNRKRRLLQELGELRASPLPPISGKDALVIMQVALIDEPERFCGELEGLLAELRERVKNGVSPFQRETRRLLVAGCPSVMGNWKIHHIIETSGGAVVCDESCTGTRYCRDLVDEGASTLDEQLEAIADRYLQIDCSCFTPNTDRIEHVLALARHHEVDAVVQYVLQYCHTYNIEAIRVGRALKVAGIPSLTVETDYSEEDAGQLRTRVEALLESLKE
ncbi:MAG: double-cubane-cluster-containing anaerobic reductase [Planctomycetota bacterium]|jgi:benzoyl-CoA reductase/2-hydroxyglutaryl-CoA dehydratase subunit BcrC/BadD/HgdB